jgi:CBS domain containing-hemolysin-like protein
MTLFPAIIAILSCFLFSALFSGIETGSYMLNRIRLRRLEMERRPAALHLGRMLRNPHIFVFTVLMGNNIAIYLLSKMVTDLYMAGGMEPGNLVFGFVPWNAEVAATLTLMFPLFLFAEVGPKNLFRKQADVLMYRLSGIMRMLVMLFYPLTWPLKQIFQLLTRGMDTSPGHDLHRLSYDALREYFSTGTKEGVLSSDQSRMVDNTTSMHRIPVRNLMTPFKGLPRLPENASVADFKRLIAKRNTTYAVLMRKHRAVGLVSMFSVINRKLDESDALEPCSEDLLSLQENRNLKSVFYRLRRNPRHCAVVVDARKHPVGFIRLEDIARYIAGD